MTPLDPGRGPLQVLVVDDSAVVRQVISEILQRLPGFSVTTASDPVIAEQKIAKQRPDVILLDLEMPRMNGLTFLERQMARDPIPVVICSGVAERGTETALRCLDAGALEIVTKPRLGVRDFLSESAVLLADALRAAATARLRRPAPAPSSIAAPKPMPSTKPPAQTLVAIGASTGGPEALHTVLEQLPPDSPGVVIVQHMPEAFTAAFAKALDRACRIEVREACDGDRLSQGTALIAPGGRHLEVARGMGHYFVHVSDGPLVSRHRPSVDVLFRSVARAAGPNALGILMTGMGDDGAEGLLTMKRAGATTVAQDEESCVVFGMPREAIRRGAADAVLPLSRISGAIVGKWCGRGPS